MLLCYYISLHAPGDVRTVSPLGGESLQEIQKGTISLFCVKTVSLSDFPQIGGVQKVRRVWLYVPNDELIRYCSHL